MLESMFGAHRRKISQFLHCKNTSFRAKKVGDIVHEYFNVMSTLNFWFYLSRILFCPVLSSTCVFRIQSPYFSAYQALYTTNVKFISLLGVLKDYLRELPEPLVTNALYQMLLDALSVRLPSDPDGSAKLMLSILECLPKANQV